MDCRQNAGDSRKRALRVLLAVIVAAALALPAWALTPLPPTVPTGVAPGWTPVPGSPEVEYAPNLKVDLFRHGKLYYYWVAGQWRIGNAPTGPWKPVHPVPPAIRHLDPALFKSIYKPKPSKD
jgi:hypothetical protein